MSLLGDIAMIFIHFHTLLIIFGLTYSLSAPQCQFLFSAVFVFQVFPLRKLPEKFRKKYIKNQRSGSFHEPEGEPEGGHQGSRRPGGAAPLLVAPGGGGPPPLRGGGGGGAPGPPRSPLTPPFGLYLTHVPKPSRREPFFAISSLFRRRRASKIRSARRTLPGTLPEGRITTGSFSTTMDASRMMRE